MAHATASDSKSMATYPFCASVKALQESRLVSHLAASMPLDLLCLHLFGGLSASLGCNKLVLIL